MRVTEVKKYIPAPLHPYLSALRRALRRSLPSQTYEDRLKGELAIFTATELVHDLPPIAHYWSNKFLVHMLKPLGFTSSMEMFRLYIARICRQYPNEICHVLSIASGDSASEIKTVEHLIEHGVRNFKVECQDLNQEVLSRGRATAHAKGLEEYFSFVASDINVWEPNRQYHVILAVQCLHHIVGLERLFDRIFRALHPRGFFAVDDMIGRNGHRRWPEAMHYVKQLWRELPQSYKYNRARRTFDLKVMDDDCSDGSFEGIRAQDILPLLVEQFHFEVFAGFGNIVDVFIDRTYGPNFDPERLWDREFIDRVHALDIQEIDAGRIKPTHMCAVMTRTRLASPRFLKHWSPEFCIRHA